MNLGLRTFDFSRAQTRAGQVRIHSRRVLKSRVCKIGSSGSRYTKRGSSEGNRGVGVRVRSCARLCVPEGRGSGCARCTSAERTPHGRGRRGYTGRVEGSQQVRCAKAQGADPRLSQSPAGRPRPHPLPLRRRPTSPPESLLAAGAEPAPDPDRSAAETSGCQLPNLSELEDHETPSPSPSDRAHLRRGVHTPRTQTCNPCQMWGWLPKGMPCIPLHSPHLLLLLLSCLPKAPSAQVMDFLFENWKLYGDQCLHNLSLLPPPTELVCNRTFDKYSCWPDTPPNTTANISCPWYLPWYHKVQHRLVFKRCGPDGQWVRGPRGQPWRNASQCQMDDEEIEVQKEVAKMYSSYQVMYTVGYSLSLGALLLALVILLGLRKMHCTRNYIHGNLFASFVLKAGSVLVVDWLLKTRYSQKIGDDLSVSIWLSDGAVAGCRVATVITQYGIIANYCWLLVEGVYLYSLLSLATFQEKSFFSLYLGIGWGAPLLFVIPWVVVKCLFENVQCWTSNDNMVFWWILRIPVLLAILINFFIFVRIIHLLVAKLRARQMHYADYKFRLARSTLTLIPLLGVHEVVFAFVTDEHAQGAVRSIKLFFDLFFSSFQGLLVAVLYCFLNKEVQAELLLRWRRWREGKALKEEQMASCRGNHTAPAGSSHGEPGEKLQLVTAGSCNGTKPSVETSIASSLSGLTDSPT